MYLSFSDPAGHVSPEGRDWSDAPASSWSGRVLTPEVPLLKVIWHNSKLNCAVNSGPLDSKYEKEILQEKNAMVMMYRRVKMKQIGGRWAGRLEVSPEKEPVRGCFFLFVSEIQWSSLHQAWTVTKAVSVAVYYIYFSKREREKFPLSKIFTFVNPKRFCWWPCCSWQEFVLFCFVSNVCSVEAIASSPRNSSSVGDFSYTVCLPWHSRFEHWAGFHQSPLWQWQMLHSSTFTSMPAGIIVVPAKQFGPGTHIYVD